MFCPRIRINHTGKSQHKMRKLKKETLQKHSRCERWGKNEQEQTSEMIENNPCYYFSLFRFSFRLSLNVLVLLPFVVGFWTTCDCTIALNYWVYIFYFVRHSLYFCSIVAFSLRSLHLFDTHREPEKKERKKVFQCFVIELVAIQCWNHFYWTLHFDFNWNKVEIKSEFGFLLLFQLVFFSSLFPFLIIFIVHTNTRRRWRLRNVFYFLFYCCGCFTKLYYAHKCSSMTHAHTRSAGTCIALIMVS